MSAQAIIEEIQKLSREDRQRVEAFLRQSISAVEVNSAEGSVAGILTRALVPEKSRMPHEMAELILSARIPKVELNLVDELLERKRDFGLTEEEELRLQDYLHANSLLIELQSRARREGVKAAAA